MAYGLQPTVSTIGFWLAFRLINKDDIKTHERGNDILILCLFPLFQNIFAEIWNLAWFVF